MPAEGAGAEGPSDAELVEQVLAGRTEAYERLVRRHQQALLRYACGMVGDPDTAADMVQDTLVRAFSRLGSFQQRDRFAGWAFQILRNRCRDHLKGPWWRRRVTLEPRGDLPAATADALETLEQRETGGAVQRALAALPVAQREAFLLKHVEELSYEEMSERLGSGVSALKMRVLRAREALQAALADDEECDRAGIRSSTLAADGNR
jgi:RNA polymerase sigma-70 factor (ECF subfamily)